MTRYLRLYLNEGRHGATVLVSPAGAAELQRPGVPTGVDGVSYAMGWEVRQLHGVQRSPTMAAASAHMQMSCLSPTANGASW